MNRAVIAGLVLLAALDVALVAFAWQRTYDDPGAAPVRASSALEEPGTGSTTAAEEGSDGGGNGSSANGGGDTDDSDDGGAPPEQAVAALAAGDLLVQATGGACPADDGAAADEAVEVATSLDGGRSFTTASIGGLTSVTGAFAGAEGRARVVGGGGAACRLRTFETTDGGETWQRLRAAPAFWTVVPGTSDEVLTPAGRADVPCEPIDVSGVDAGVARLWCSDGELLGTASAGNEWVTVGRMEDAIALAFTAPATGYALTEGSDCPGVAVSRTDDGGTSWREVHCSEVGVPAALGADDDAVVVVGADAVDASTDGGASWSLR